MLPMNSRDATNPTCGAKTAVVEPGVVGLVYTGDCYSASYANAMTGLGLDPVVLGDRWGYSWRPDPDEPLGDIRLCPLDFGAVVAEWFPVDIRECIYPDGRECLDSLVADPTRVAILGVDSYWLAHSSNSQTGHFPHAVAARGTVDGKLAVVDGYRGASFVGPVAVAQLLPAVEGMRQFTHRHRSLQREHIELEPRDVLALELVPRDVAGPPSAGAVLARLRATAREYATSTVVHLDEKYMNGPAALRAAADAFEHADQTRLTDEHVRYVLACLASIASQRNLNAAFVGLGGELTGSARLTELAARMQQTGRRWISLRNAMYLRTTRNPAALSRYAARMRELVDEDAAVTADIECAAAAG
jgi:hypothetical protein